MLDRDGQVLWLAYVYENTASKLRPANLSAAQEPAEGVAIHCGLAAQTEEALGPAGAGESRWLRGLRSVVGLEQEAGVASRSEARQQSEVGLEPEVEEGNRSR